MEHSLAASEKAAAPTAQEEEEEVEGNSSPAAASAHQEAGSSSSATTRPIHTQDDDIEAQLRRQRQKQAERQAASSVGGDRDDDPHTKPSAKKELPRQRLGKYVYDSERDAYFEEGDFILAQQQKQQQEQEQQSLEDAKGAACDAGADLQQRSYVWSYLREIGSNTNSSRLCHHPRLMTSRWRGCHFLSTSRTMVVTGSYSDAFTRNYINHAGAAESQVVQPLWNRTLDVMVPPPPRNNTQIAAPPHLMRLEQANPNHNWTWLIQRPPCPDPSRSESSERSFGSSRKAPTSARVTVVEPTF